MIDYERHLRTVIETGDYVLADLEDRIDAIWVEGHITADARAELKVLAAENARDRYEDLAAALLAMDARVTRLEDEQYPVYTAGMLVGKGEIVREDVTGDGNLDLCQYDGGRASTTAHLGKISGWYLLDRELAKTHTISYDPESKTYALTPVGE